jgi:hypothetical protein
MYQWGAVAERLVGRTAAAAQGLAVPDLVGGAVRGQDLHPTPDPVGSIRDRIDALGQIVLQLVVTDRDAEGPRGALLDLGDDGVHIGGGGVDPGLFPELEDRSQIVGAEPGMSAHGTVVVDGDTLADVVVPAPGDRALVGGLGAVEADPDVGAVTERLVGRPATATERVALRGVEHLTPGANLQPTLDEQPVGLPAAVPIEGQLIQPLLRSEGVIQADNPETTPLTDITISHDQRTAKPGLAPRPGGSGVRG